MPTYMGIFSAKIICWVSALYARLVVNFTLPVRPQSARICAVFSSIPSASAKVRHRFRVPRICPSAGPSAPPQADKAKSSLTQAMLA